MSSHFSRDNGYEGIALEFQQTQMMDTKRMADSMEEIARTLANLGVIAQRFAAIIEQLPVQGDRPDAADIFPVYDQ